MEGSMNKPVELTDDQKRRLSLQRAYMQVAEAEHKDDNEIKIFQAKLNGAKAEADYQRDQYEASVKKLNGLMEEYVELLKTYIPAEHRGRIV
jgi:multidrug resistance efflux pump